MVKVLMWVGFVLFIAFLAHFTVHPVNDPEPKNPKRKHKIS